MDLGRLKDLRSLCTRDDPVFCTNECPLGVDVKTIAGKIGAGDFTGAYNTYRSQVLFPDIVSRICTQPCLRSCIRARLDDPVSIRLLERACCHYTGSKEIQAFYIPPKNKKTAVIGGGLRGISCAVRLARKGYGVDLYDANDRLGGWLLDSGGMIPEDIVELEFASVLADTGITLHLGNYVTSLAGLDYHAFYIATGPGGDTFGLEEGFDPVSLATVTKGIFLSSAAGGSLERSLISSIREGGRVAQAMENYLKTGKMGGDAGRDEVTESRLHADLSKAAVKRLVIPADPDGYSREEAAAEAKRCLQCACDACARACELIRYYRKKPKKIIDDVVASMNVVTAITTRVASRQINSCNLCGLCKEACPNGLDFNQIFLESRRLLHQGGNLPAAFHEFWLNDMEFSNSEQAFVIIGPAAGEKRAHMFFPGCQLGASDPRYVTEAYRYLRERLNGDVSVMTGCCGAPAEWAGRAEQHRAVCRMIKDYWEKQGRPVVILACPTCKLLFRRHLPEVPVESLWDRDLFTGLPPGKAADGQKVRVFDSCASRHDPGVRDSIRRMVGEAGFVAEEFPYSGEYAQCCGYGGQIHAVNQRLLDEITANRAQAAPYDYVVYCTNCRDTFAAAGKPAVHILDLLFSMDTFQSRAERKPPTLAERRENRVLLKKLLLKEWSGCELQPPENEFAGMMLYFSAEVRDKMERDLILPEDAQRTIRHCESTGNKILDHSGNYIGHLQHGAATYWVVYKPESDGFRLQSIYSHRLIIEEAAK